jgi:hypothetical protein
MPVPMAAAMPRMVVIVIVCGAGHATIIPPTTFPAAVLQVALCVVTDQP